MNQPHPDGQPCLAKSTAIKLLSSSYGLSATVESLPGYHDQNFRVQTDSGEEFVLKISNPREDPDLLDLQTDALNFLAGREVSFKVPLTIPTKDGESRFSYSENETPTWVRLLSYLKGDVLAGVQPRTAPLLESLGQCLGQLDVELSGFEHAAARRREFLWDLSRANYLIEEHLGHLTDHGRRAMVENIRVEFESTVVPFLDELPRSIIHNDANDYNVLVSDPSPQGRTVIGLLDFADISESPTICELAIAAAYGIMGTANPVAMILALVRGYNEVRPLTELELEVLFPLIRARLGVSVSLSASHSRTENRDPYLSISEMPAWSALDHLSTIHPRLARNLFRDVCGMEPCPRHQEVKAWIKAHKSEMGPLVLPSLDNALVFDLSPASPEIDDLDEVLDVPLFSTRIFRRMEEAGADVGVGRYGEPRLWYTSAGYAKNGGDFPERRTVHTAIDLFLQAGSPVFAPLPGRIHSLRNNSVRLDYGPTVVLEHSTKNGPTFYTLYGHLSENSLDPLEAGQPIDLGQEIARLGNFPSNGDWPPHLHFQLITDLLDMEGDFPGVALPSQGRVWLSLSPDPGLMLTLPPGSRYQPPVNSRVLRATRQTQLGPSLSLSYREPLHLVRGWKQHLFDAEGQAYLDGVNNVCHVGHCHPRVVAAARQQMGVLNTNTRYLNANILEYADRLTATLPDPLSVCFFVNSGSEANELALRMARAYTGSDDLIVVEGAYHGNTAATLAASPYKFDGPGGEGPASHVHTVPMPDDYRGAYDRSDPERGKQYARTVDEIVQSIQDGDFGPATFICESLLSCGGQIELPPGYLEAAYGFVREAGGLCIADEVQVGFGRVGSHFWGFETQSVVPDIVTMGKPIGNGHPLSAVVTTHEIAQTFDNGMEYFNTFGGNPVSCAVGLAVLDVIEEEDLQVHAHCVGEHLLKRLRSLMDFHPSLGDVRGRGLFLGVEVVSDVECREPAADVASYIVERMKRCGILLSTDGPAHNVIKIKPPMTFTEEDANRVAQVMGKVFLEDFVTRPV
ncbi:MAG: aminotransferase class III-fold pyridoxal phosphate-dependent enzyme [Gemmatimonadota bacterium]|nr:aminotransferase class III-fold pyridoxal phosphate-dependent enzyme [Gemmatimonadota bacterium]